MVTKTRKAPGKTRTKDAVNRGITATRETQPAREGAAKAAKKPNKHKTKAKQLLSDEKLVEDVLHYFETLPGFSYVVKFPGRDVSHHQNCGPNLASAVELLTRKASGMAYLGPFPDPETPAIEYPWMAKERCPEIVRDVETRLEKLRQRGIQFAAAWAAYGELYPHLDWCGDYDESQVCYDLSEVIKEWLGILFN
jgi:hypothetical protein